MSIELFTELKSLIIFLVILFWIAFISDLAKKPKTNKLGLFLIFSSTLTFFSYIYYLLKDNPPNIETYKKLCGTYENNYYESTRRGRGSYIYYFSLENYGDYKERANDKHIAQIGRYPYYKQFDLNGIQENQKVCIYISFNVFKPSMTSTLAIDPLTPEHPLLYKRLCGVQTQQKSLGKISKDREETYQTTFELENYGRFDLVHEAKSDLIGDNQFTNSNQRVCLLVQLPKRGTEEALKNLQNYNILLIELKDQVLPKYKSKN
ncbi:MAG: hypothetical protein RSA22_05875 [Acinetobacter sp.]|jgi:hypothetical protein